MEPDLKIGTIKAVYQSCGKSLESLKRASNTLQVGRLKLFRISTGIPSIRGDIPLLIHVGNY